MHIENAIFKKNVLDKKSIKIDYFLDSLVSSRENKLYRIKKIIERYQSKIVFQQMEINYFDQQSLKSFQNLIKNNNMKRKDVICTSSELKDKLFAKLEGRE